MKLKIEKKTWMDDTFLLTTNWRVMNEQRHASTLHLFHCATHNDNFCLFVDALNTHTHWPIVVVLVQFSVYYNLALCSGHTIREQTRPLDLNI